MWLRLVGSRVCGPQHLCTGLVAHSMWDLSGPGIEPVSPASAGRFSTTGLPGKPSPWHFEGTYIFVEGLSNHMESAIIFSKIINLYKYF